MYAAAFRIYIHIYSYIWNTSVINVKMLQRDKRINNGCVRKEASNKQIFDYVTSKIFQNHGNTDRKNVYMRIIKTKCWQLTREFRQCKLKIYFLCKCEFGKYLTHNCKCGKFGEFGNSRLDQLKICQTC